MSKVTPNEMPFSEIPNDQVASVGREFRETVDFLYESIQLVHCVSPLLMMAAFGIELFLKCLNAASVYHRDDMLVGLEAYRVTAEPLTKGHRLVVLLDALDVQIQEGLNSTYARNPVIPGKATLRDALAEYDTLFVNARYPFEDEQEGRSRSITGLVKLLDLIGDHVGSLPKQVRFANTPARN